MARSRTMPKKKGSKNTAKGGRTAGGGPSELERMGGMGGGRKKRMSRRGY